MERLRLGEERWKEDMRMRDLGAVIRVICVRHGLPADALLSGARGRWFSEARREIVRVARQRLGCSDAAIAAALGVSRQTIWRLGQPDLALVAAE